MRNISAMPPKSSLAEVVDTFSFVVAEVHRLHDMMKNGRGKEAFSESGLHDHLAGERGEFPHRHYSCSRAATTRLADLASARIEQDLELRGRIIFGTYFNAIRTELGVRAVRDGEIVTEVLAKEILKAAKAAATSKLISARYFFPVYGVEEPSSGMEYAIGAVRFEQAAAFFKRCRSEWDTSVEQSLAEWKADYTAKGGGFDEDFLRKNFTRVEDHFCGYRWMAFIEIADVEKDVGYKQAEDVIDKTCSLLRLFIPSWRGSFIGVASQRKNDRERGRFMSRRSGRYETSISFGDHIGAPVEANFLTNMRKIVGVPQIEAMLGKLDGRMPLTAGEQRLLAALTWFGEAWKDEHLEAKLVKYAICLEGLFMTGAKEGLVELLAERLALFAELDYSQIQVRYDQVKEVYDARSKAVHGDSAKDKIDFVRLSRTAEELAALGIFAYAQLIPFLGECREVNAKLSKFFAALKLGGKERALDTLRESEEMT